VSEMSRKVKEHYQLPQDEDCREKIVRQYIPLVKKIAARLSVALPPSLEKEDLIGCGIIGLLEAWERYDSSRGASFASFASWRIKGAMLDELRKVTPAPRNLFNRFRQLSGVADSLRQQLQREPEQTELASALGWPLSAVEQMWAYYNLLALTSLEATLFYAQGEENLPAGELIAGLDETPEAIALRKERQRQLTEALGLLDEREKLILSLLYAEDLSQKEIADVLNISTGRVSQLHARAVARLREILLAE